MKHMMVLLFTLLFSNVAMADYYSCAKMVYKDGWLRKYDMLGEKWGVTTKKHGIVSSTVYTAAEKLTSSLDPGVMTGSFMSTGQYTSSWGECSMLDYNITKQMREEYLEQNLGEIKKQVAMGKGDHVDSLAFVSGCHNLDQAEWSRQLQSNTAEFYDAVNGKVFAEQLDTVISKSFKNNCRAI